MHSSYIDANSKIFVQEKKSAFCGLAWEKKNGIKNIYRQRNSFFNFYEVFKYKYPNTKLKQVRRFLRRHIKIRKKRKIIYYNNLQSLTGILHCNISENNTIISFSTIYGKKQFSISAGNFGFKKVKRASIYAAQIVMKNTIERCSSSIKPSSAKSNIILILKGLHKKRIPTIKTLKKIDAFRISAVYDKTAYKHGGCQKPKKRRI